ncbi:MAG: tetratricopeptide repeat protein, partial [Desulfomonilaceae bacterium]
MTKVLYLLVLMTLIVGSGVVKAQEEPVEFYNKGVEALAQDRLDDAISLFKQAVKVDPVDHYAYNNLGVAYKRKGDYDKAIENYSRALEIMPDYYAARVNRGIARFRRGDYDLALEDLEAVLRQHKRDPSVYATLGLIYKQKGDLDQAIKNLKTAIALNKNGVVAQKALGEVYEAKKDYEKALDVYIKLRAFLAKKGQTDEIDKRIDHLRTSYVSELYSQGLEEYRLGNAKHALAIWTTALKLDPGNIQIFRDRGLTYYKLGQY